jgi:hypothetical protein
MLLRLDHHRPWPVAVDVQDRNHPSHSSSSTLPGTRCGAAENAPVFFFASTRIRVSEAIAACVTDCQFISVRVGWTESLIVSAKAWKGHTARKPAKCRLRVAHVVAWRGMSLLDCWVQSGACIGAPYLRHVGSYRPCSGCIGRCRFGRSLTRTDPRSPQAFFANSVSSARS